VTLESSVWMGCPGSYNGNKLCCPNGGAQGFNLNLGNNDGVGTNGERCKLLRVSARTRVRLHALASTRARECAAARQRAPLPPAFLRTRRVPQRVSTGLQAWLSRRPV
jgi:hypothetical protein